MVKNHKFSGGINLCLYQQISMLTRYQKTPPELHFKTSLPRNRHDWVVLSKIVICSFWDLKVPSDEIGFFRETSQGKSGSKINETKEAGPEKNWGVAIWRSSALRTRGVQGGIGMLSSMSNVGRAIVYKPSQNHHKCINGWYKPSKIWVVYYCFTHISRITTWQFNSLWTGKSQWLIGTSSTNGH